MKATMIDQKLLRTIQQFEAVTSIGPSAIRNHGKGVIASVRSYLSEVALDQIPMESELEYLAWMDRHTDVLCNKMPVDGHCFGTARKSINLFLRTAFYNHYLRTAFNLERIEAWLEIPVDSVIADCLKRDAPGGDELPRWPGLKHLKKEQHARYQECASRLARDLNLPARVFLDNILWLER